MIFWKLVERRYFKEKLAIVFVFLTFIIGCKTRQISSIQLGMTVAEVTERFGKPGKVEAGLTNKEFIWYYYAYMAYPYKKWVYVPSGDSQYGGNLQQIQTSAGVRYPKFRIVFTNGVVSSAAELARPDI